MRSCRKYGVSFNSNMSTKTLLRQWAKVPVAMMKKFVEIAKSNPEILATKPNLQAVFNNLTAQFPDLTVPPIPSVPAIPTIPIPEQLDNYEQLILSNATLVSGFVAYLNNPDVPQVIPPVPNIIQTSVFPAINSAMTAINVVDTTLETLYQAEKVATIAYEVAKEVLDAAVDAAAPAKAAATATVVANKAVNELAKQAAVAGANALEISRTALYTLIEAS